MKGGRGGVGGGGGLGRVIDSGDLCSEFGFVCALAVLMAVSALTSAAVVVVVVAAVVVASSARSESARTC